MVLIDYHVHSTFSADSKTPIEDYCVRAVKLGFTEIGFSEHVDFDPRDWGYGFYNHDLFQTRIEEIRERYDRQLKILMGVEIDYQEKFEEKIRNFLLYKDFDYLIGAVHYADNSIVINDDYFLGKTSKVAYETYLDRVEKAAESGFFDIIGHLDYVKGQGVKFYGKFDFKEVSKKVSRILRAIVERNLSLEVNTAGLRYPCNETLPGMEALKLYKELGGCRLVLGSDAHTVENLGYRFTEVLKAVKKIGFDSLSTFEKRNSKKIKISFPDSVRSD